MFLCNMKYKPTETKRKKIVRKEAKLHVLIHPLTGFNSTTLFYNSPLLNTEYHSYFFFKLCL